MRPRAPEAPTGAGRPLRVAIVADLSEERWPSMDLVAVMLARHLGTIGERSGLHVELLRPTLARGSRQPGEVPDTFERFKNRFWDYPRWLRTHVTDFDVFITQYVWTAGFIEANSLCHGHLPLAGFSSVARRPRDSGPP